MPQQPDTFWNDPTDIYQFTEYQIKTGIFKLPDVDHYKIITASSPELLARRVRYFLYLNPEWITLGGLVISSGPKDFEYRDNIGQMRNLINVTDNIYHQTFIRSTTTPAPAAPAATAAAGGSIRQNSRKIRVQRKKRD